MKAKGGNQKWTTKRRRKQWAQNTQDEDKKTPKRHNTKKTKSKKVKA